MSNTCRTPSSTRETTYPATSLFGPMAARIEKSLASPPAPPNPYFQLSIRASRPPVMPCWRRIDSKTFAKRSPSKVAGRSIERSGGSRARRSRDISVSSGSAVTESAADARRANRGRRT